MDSQTLAQQLVKDWQKPIYNFALRWFGDENRAADATQETFLVALRDLHQLRSPSKLKSWIFTVARRVMIHQGRRKQPEALESDLISDGPASSQQAIEQERRERIESELAKLPEELRTVLILHFFHDLSQVEMAAQLSIPRTTIQSQLKRGLETLRTKLVACGASYGVVELEQRFRSIPFSEVPSSLQAKLGSMVAPTALTGSVAVIGGMIVKLKLIGLGALVVALGVGTWLFVEDGLNAPNDQRPQKSRSQALLELSKENQALKKRLSRMKAQVQGQKKTVDPASQESPDDLGTLEKTFQAVTADNEKLRNQIAHLKAQLSNDSSASLVAKYVRLTNEAEREMKALNGDEKKKYEAKITPILFPLIMKLTAKPAATAESILDALADPNQERKDLLTGLLPTIFTNQKLAGKERDHFNKRAIALCIDRTVDLKVREAILGQLQLDGSMDTEDSRELADAILHMVRDKQSPLREDAVMILGKLPFDDASAAMKSLIMDETEPADLRSLAFVYGASYEKPGGEVLTLKLMRDPATVMRRVAYEFASSIKNPSDQVCRQLEDALVSEKARELIPNILESLEDIGNEQSLETLQKIIDDATQPLPLRSKAKKCWEVLQSRLKK